MATEDGAPTSTGDELDTESLVAAVGDGLRNGMLPAAVFNHRGVHEAELRRIFGEHWVFVGHETEIPEAGDYAQRYVGNDPFIFARDEDGEIRVLFDSCRHHGAKLCKAEQGNTSHFRCPYHGWTYKNTGELAGVPQKGECFPGLDTDDYALHEAPRVENYKGLVFVSLSEEGPSLEEHLGDFKWYVDTQIEFAKGGLEVVGEPHRWRVDANWKTGADNFAGDSYHTQMTHKSVLDVGYAAEDFSGSPDRTFDQRHITHIHTGSISLRMLAADSEEEFHFGYPSEYVTDERLDDDQWDLFRRSGIAVGNAFPTFSFIHAAYTEKPGKPLCGYLSIRTWRPVSEDEMEIWSWVLVPAAADEAYKRRAYDTAVQTFSSSGNFEQDDIAVWDGMTRSAGSVFAEKNDVELNYQMGLPEMSEAAIDEAFPGPGTAWDTNLEEGTMRTFYANWYKAMTDQPLGVSYGDGGIR